MNTPPTLTTGPGVTGLSEEQIRHRLLALGRAIGQAIFQGFPL